MAECPNQTQEIRDKAQVRLDRYLAMARDRMRARHQKEKAEKQRPLVAKSAPPPQVQAIPQTIRTTVAK